MRFRAMKELGMKEAPCTVISKETSLEDLKAYVVLDNSPFGQWNWQMLQSEDWSAEQLTDWGVELPIMETHIDIDNFFDSLDENDDQKAKPDHITVVLPDNLKESKTEIKNVIKEALSKYNGIIYK